MTKQTHFRFDENTFEYKPIQPDLRDKWVYAVIHWSLSTVLVTILGYTLLGKLTLSPGELSLSQENQILLGELLSTQTKISSLEEHLAALQESDNQMYRSILGMPKIDEEVQMGVGGTDIYASFDLLSEQASQILRETQSTLDKLERQTGRQSLSFEEIKAAYNKNREKMKHLPAIRPINGVLLSGYGVRIHPVYNRQRMHDGVDFRADVGTPVYATGDAKIRSAGRNGTYGNLLILDHGFGYETRYAHLSGFTEGIRAGKNIKRGDLIGYSGDTGLTSGPHLHYEILKDGEPVDPLNYMFADITPEEYLLFREISDNNPMSMD